MAAIEQEVEEYEAASKAARLAKLAPPSLHLRTHDIVSSVSISGITGYNCTGFCTLRPICTEWSRRGWTAPPVTVLPRGGRDGSVDPIKFGPARPQLVASWVDHPAKSINPEGLNPSMLPYEPVECVLQPRRHGALGWY